jgi:uncharacterized protein
VVVDQFWSRLRPTRDYSFTVPLLDVTSLIMARRALHEWLEIVPADHILWGSDSIHAEGIYGATVVTRRCLAEVLAEKVIRGDITEPQAEKIGRMIMRENAIGLYPRLARYLNGK